MVPGVAVRGVCVCVCVGGGGGGSRHETKFTHVKSA